MMNAYCAFLFGNFVCLLNSVFTHIHVQVLLIKQCVHNNKLHIVRLHKKYEIVSSMYEERYRAEVTQNDYVQYQLAPRILQWDIIT